MRLVASLLAMMKMYFCVLQRKISFNQIVFLAWARFVFCVVDLLIKLIKRRQIEVFGGHAWVKPRLLEFT